jgi:hypothetical protein
MDTHNIKENLINQVLLDYKAEYAELVEVYRDLERKALFVITICGFLIAGSVSFIKPELHLIFNQKIYLSITLGFVFLTILLCVALFFVRNTKNPPRGKETDCLVKDLFKLESPHEINNRYINFLNDQISGWEICCKEFRDKIINSKWKLLVSAQFSLFAAIGLSLIGLITFLFN